VIETHPVPEWQSSVRPSGTSGRSSRSRHRCAMTHGRGGSGQGPWAQKSSGFRTGSLRADAGSGDQHPASRKERSSRSSKRAGPAFRSFRRRRESFPASSGLEVTLSWRCQRDAASEVLPRGRTRQHRGRSVGPRERHAPLDADGEPTTQSFGEIGRASAVAQHLRTLLKVPGQA
jgi:hypothetical protein